MKNTNFKKVAGFTLDQTILVVAVIAVLATVIISSVAWDVLSRANSTKLNAHLQQIGNSIGEYYQNDNGAGKYVWPTTAADLAGYLAGYTADGDDLRAPFGTAANPSRLSLLDDGKSLTTDGVPVTNCVAGANDCYFVINFTNLQAQEVETANEAIDGAGEQSPRTQGRLRWTTGTGSALVTVSYFAMRN